MLALSIKNEKRFSWASVWKIDKNASEFCFSINSPFKQEHLPWCDRETIKYRKSSVHSHCAEALAKSVSFDARSFHSGYPKELCLKCTLTMFFASIALERSK